MPSVVTKQRTVSRRRLLQGLIALPPLTAMFNANGTAYAAQRVFTPERRSMAFARLSEQS